MGCSPAGVGAIVVTVVWLEAGVVVEVTLARIALHNWLAVDDVIAVVDAVELVVVVVRSRRERRRRQGNS